MFRASIYTYTPGGRLPLYYGSVLVFGEVELTPRLAHSILAESGHDSGAVLRYVRVPGAGGRDYWRPAIGYRVYSGGRVRKIKVV